MSNAAKNRSFERYWASIHLPGPDSPLFKPYVAAYDAARRAYEAGMNDRSLGDEQIIDELRTALDYAHARLDDCEHQPPHWQWSAGGDQPTIVDSEV